MHDKLFGSESLLLERVFVDISAWSGDFLIIRIIDETEVRSVVGRLGLELRVYVGFNGELFELALVLLHLREREI